MKYLPQLRKLYPNVTWTYLKEFDAYQAELGDKCCSFQFKGLNRYAKEVIEYRLEQLCASAESQ